MSKQFVKGNVYVFTKKRYMKDMCQSHSEAFVKFHTGDWTNRVNGNEVRITGSFTGDIGMYAVVATWCKCIKNNNPKFKEEN